MAGRKLSRRLEDYLEAVLVLIRRDGAARVRDIAARTEVSKSTVTAALKQLDAAGLVHHDPYQLVTLTDRGRAVAGEICHRHEALVEFLTEVLAVDAKQAEANACRMEHVLDDEVVDRLAVVTDIVSGDARRQRRWRRRLVAGRTAGDDPSRESSGASHE
jgi:DtxR family Mn-dependent transcriptional regulator